tara:strand:- start:632 stop:859 length:228 start_codon:yes stop_codon:yes gene_type:complete
MKKLTEIIAAYVLAGFLVFVTIGVTGCGPAHDPSEGGTPAQVNDGEDGDGSDGDEDEGGGKPEGEGDEEGEGEDG